MMMIKQEVPLSFPPKTKDLGLMLIPIASKNEEHKYIQST